MTTFTSVIIGLLLVVIAVSFFLPNAGGRSRRATEANAALPQLERNWIALWALTLLAAVAASVLHYFGPLTGVPYLDGSIGVALGLYICSHPAANAVNMLFYERYLFRYVPSDWSTVRWFSLNLLVLLAGWVVIFNGLLLLVT